MSKNITIETKGIETITLYDEEDFYEAKEQTLRLIDNLITYLNDAKVKIGEFEPSDIYRPSKELGRYSNGLERNNILDKIHDDLYTEDEDGYGSTYGYYANMINELYILRRISWNLYYQERFADRIEENWTHFH